MDKHTTKRVNFRRQPGFGNNVIAVLEHAQRVEVTGDLQGDRWLPVRAVVGGNDTEGFVSKNVLRDPLSDSRESLIKECVKEWARFERGAAKENQNPHAQFVGEMWQAIGMDLDGFDRDMPWSAAFISFVVRKAGGYDGFRFSASHSRYVHLAIKEKLAGSDHPFWGFRIHDHRVELGDMVCRWRRNRIDYDHAASSQWFKSHCDIVIAIEDAAVLTVGGNVSNSVGHTRYKITADGFLTPAKNVYAVLSNRR